MMDRIVSKRYQILPSSQPFIPGRDPTSQTTVTCVHHTHIFGIWRNVTITWMKNVMNYSLTVSIDAAANDVVFTCKIDLKPWHIWAKKGYKSFEVDGNNKLEVYWDLKSAKFAGSPEPCSDFYVALIAKSEVVLLLGDCKKKAYKRTKAMPALMEAMMFYKKENVFGKKSFTTRAKFDQRKRDHEVVVESSTTGPRDPEMWISIDGIVLMHVENLHWKFRGNRTVLVDEQPIQVFWDVFGWLYCEPGSTHGMFIFKSGESEVGESDEDSQCSGDSSYYSVQSYRGSSPQLSLFLYAWKI
ncbi:hypothetical protein ACS0TY_012603 [Phlomoides rotata]